MSAKLLSRPSIWGALCALVLIPYLVGPAHAAAPSTVNAPRIHSAPADAPITVPVAADRFGWLWTFLENTLHSRTRMVQFGVIGMCIALYFMFRARG